LAAASPEEAVDTFLDRIRAALDCVVNCTAYGSGGSEGVNHSLAFYAAGQTVPNLARLRTHGGIGELLFRFGHSYVVAPSRDGGTRDAFVVNTTFYQYRILDYGGDEVVVYDWDPDGPSPVRTPHLHVPAAGSIILKQRTGSPLAQQRTFLGSLHLPTGAIVLEDIVELLIREFQVVPRRTDWEAVLAANRKPAG
jgi:hypothetical protein